MKKYFIRIIFGSSSYEDIIHASKFLIHDGVIEFLKSDSTLDEEIFHTLCVFPVNNIIIYKIQDVT